MTNDDVLTGVHPALGREYKLTRDIYESRVTKHGKLRRVKLHRNGERFLFTDDGHGAAYLAGIGKARSAFPDSPRWAEIVSALVEDDLRGALKLRFGNGDNFKELLFEVIKSKSGVTLDELVAATQLELSRMA